MTYLSVLFAICSFAVIIDMGMTKPGIPVSSKDQQKFNVLVIAVLIYFAGFRNMGGTDFNVYYRIFSASPYFSDFFDKYDTLQDNSYLYGVEKGYIFINSVVKSMGFTYFGYNLLHSLFCIGTVYFCTRKYTNNYSIVIMIILYKMFFYDFCISLRQTITIVLFFYMLKDIEKKRPIRYFALCFLCYWIHSAAIILFVIYFIGYMKLTRKKIILLNVIFIPTIALSVFNVPVLKIFNSILGWDIFATEQVADKATNLIEGISEQGIDWIHTVEYFGIMLLLIIFHDEIIKEFPSSEIMIKLFVCLLPLFTIVRNYEILTRLKDYFTISYGFILSYIASIRNREQRIPVVIFLILWTGFGFFRFIYLFDNGAFLNYMPIRKYVKFFIK